MMGWRAYTKLVETTEGVCMRWYWCRQLPHGSLESPVGFPSRSSCEADAISQGCKPEDREPERRTTMSRLLAGAGPRG